MSLFDLSGKVCVVTGGTSGIGRATVERMIEQGAQVVLTSREEGVAQSRAAELNDKFGENRAFGLPFDLMNRSQGRELIERTAQKWGRIDTLVCNAAHVVLGRLETLGDDMETMGISLEMNVRNYASLTRHAVPVMRNNGGGSVIYILSTAGFVAAPPFLSYGLAKAALAHMTKVLAVDFGDYNIRVNSIVPGLIRASATMEQYITKIPLKRHGEPDDIASMAVLLASPNGTYITGQSIVIDGGSLLKGTEGITEGYDMAAALRASNETHAAEAQ